MRQSDRLEREINEILERAEGERPLASPRKAAFHKARRDAAFAVSAWEHARLRDLSRSSPVRMVVLAFVLLCAGFVLDEVLPYEGYWLTIAGALLFVPAFALVVFRRDRRRERDRDRGRPPRRR